jgi:hypothetical protein
MIPSKFFTSHTFYIIKQSPLKTSSGLFQSLARENVATDHVGAAPHRLPSRPTAHVNSDEDNSFMVRLKSLLIIMRLSAQSTTNFLD